MDESIEVKIARLEERLDSVIDGQKVIFEKLDKGLGKCPVGEQHSNVVNCLEDVKKRLDNLERNDATNEAEKATARRYNAMLIGITGTIVGIVTWLVTFIVDKLN
jgi:hypothetical protein